jgi:hypothetical protein
MKSFYGALLTATFGLSLFGSAALADPKWIEITQQSGQIEGAPTAKVRTSSSEDCVSQVRTAETELVNKGFAVIKSYCYFNEFQMNGSINNLGGWVGVIHFAR